MTSTETAIAMDGPLPAGLQDTWEEFFKSKFDPANEATYNVYTHPLLFPLQRRMEAVKMTTEAAKIHPRTVLDIGSDKGASVYQWCQLVTVRNIIACEVRGTPYSKAFEDHFHDVDFLWLAQSSYDSTTVRDVQRWLGRTKIDITFIDGDKSYFMVDFDAYLPLMNPNGIIFFHDITDPAPGEAYRSICARGFRHEEIIDISETQPLLGNPPARMPKTEHDSWLKHWAGRSCGVGCIYLDGDKK